MIGNPLHRIKTATLYPLYILGVFLLFALAYSCNNDSDTQCRGNIQSPCVPIEQPHPTLSDYNIFEGPLHHLEPISNVLPYNLNTPLFSDYAQKQRFIYVPQDTFTTYREERVLNFPVGSILVKNFYYDLNQQAPSSKRRIIETRLLMHQDTGWTAETYVWNEQQNEAFLQQSGGHKNVNWIDQTGTPHKATFIIPTKNDCKKCHSHNNSLAPLGPKVHNLNKTYPYDDGQENQLIKWEEHGILGNRPSQQNIPKAPVWNDPTTGSLSQRARIYLDVNCGNCHSPSGSADYTGLFLTYHEKDSTHLGIYKTPVAAGRGSGGLQYDIVPGKPGRSILIYRMDSTDPAVRMPEIGRTLVHDEAVSLIKKWIQKMD